MHSVLPRFKQKHKNSLCCCFRNVCPDCTYVSAVCIWLCLLIRYIGDAVLFNSAEISVEQELLFKIVTDVDMDCLPRCVSRGMSDDKVNGKFIIHLVLLITWRNTILLASIRSLWLIIWKCYRRSRPMVLTCTWQWKGSTLSRTKVEAVSMHYPVPPTGRVFKLDKRLEHKLDLTVTRLGIYGLMDKKH